MYNSNVTLSIWRKQRHVLWLHFWHVIVLCRTVDCTCTGSLLQWFPELVLDNIDPQRIHEDDHYLLWCGKCLGLGHRWDEYSHSRLSEWIYLCINLRNRRIAQQCTSTFKTTLHKMYNFHYLYAVMVVMSLNQPKTATIAYIAIAPKMMQATTDLLTCSDNWGAIINIQDLIPPSHTTKANTHALWFSVACWGYLYPCSLSELGGGVSALDHILYVSVLGQGVFGVGGQQHCVIPE